MRRRNWLSSGQLLQQSVRKERISEVSRVMNKKEAKRQTYRDKDGETDRQRQTDRQKERDKYIQKDSIVAESV